MCMKYTHVYTNNTRYNVKILTFHIVRTSVSDPIKICFITQQMTEIMSKKNKHSKKANKFFISCNFSSIVQQHLSKSNGSRFSYDWCFIDYSALYNFLLSGGKMCMAGGRAAEHTRYIFDWKVYGLPILSSRRLTNSHCALLKRYISNVWIHSMMALVGERKMLKFSNFQYRSMTSHMCVIWSWVNPPTHIREFALETAAKQQSASIIFFFSPVLLSEFLMWFHPFLPRDDVAALGPMETHYKIIRTFFHYIFAFFPPHLTFDYEKWQGGE